MNEQGPLSEFGESRVAELEDQREAAGTPQWEKLRYYGAMLLSLWILGAAFSVLIAIGLLVTFPIHGGFRTPIRMLLMDGAALIAGHLARKRLVGDRWWWEY